MLRHGRTRRVPGLGTQPLSGRIDLSGPQGAQLRTAIASVHRICPEFAPVQVLRRSGRSVLLVGTTGRSTAVADVLDHSSIWAERIGAESRHRSFVRHQPPVQVPRLIAADPNRFRPRDRADAGAGGRAAAAPGGGAAPRGHPGGTGCDLPG